MRRKTALYWKTQSLVEDFEELVEMALQEVVQPLNQLDQDAPYCSPIHSPPHSPLKIMANVNANQPPNPPNPPPAWRARSPLNLAPRTIGDM